MCAGIKIYCQSLPMANTSVTDNKFIYNNNIYMCEDFVKRLGEV